MWRGRAVAELPVCVRTPARHAGRRERTTELVRSTGHGRGAGEALDLDRLRAIRRRVVAELAIAVVAPTVDARSRHGARVREARGQLRHGEPSGDGLGRVVTVERSVAELTVAVGTPALHLARRVDDA